MHTESGKIILMSVLLSRNVNQSESITLWSGICEILWWGHILKLKTCSQQKSCGPNDPVECAAPVIYCAWPRQSWALCKTNPGFLICRTIRQISPSAQMTRATFNCGKLEYDKPSIGGLLQHKGCRWELFGVINGHRLAAHRDEAVKGAQMMRCPSILHCHEIWMRLMYHRMLHVLGCSAQTV